MADELIAEVRAALHDEVADVTASPSLLATVRRRHRRRVLARRFGLTVPVLAAAVAAAVVLAPGAVPPQKEKAPPVPANAAYVVRHVTEALDEVADAIAYERAIVTEGDKYSPPGRPTLYERWIPADGSSFRLFVSLRGVPQHDLSYDSDSYLDVDYRTRTYLVRAGIEMNSGTLNDVWTPKEIQQGLASGLITVIGPAEKINGKATVKLRRSEQKADVPMILWVDATTYLPVRWQYEGDHTVPFDISWVPRTPANVANLTARIPPGFTKKDSY
jgi:hypothetical protein